MQNERINFTFRLFILNNYYKFVANRGVWVMISF